MAKYQSTSKMIGDDDPETLLDKTASEWALRTSDDSAWQ